jgi:hypothetical protein
MDHWRIIGNHRHSDMQADPNDPGNPVLHLVATGPTEHMHNHAETTFANRAQVSNGREVEIRFRAKWITGSPLLHTRLFFNRLPRTTVLPVPTRSGTPGAPPRYQISVTLPLRTPPPSWARQIAGVGQPMTRWRRGVTLVRPDIGLAIRRHEPRGPLCRPHPHIPATSWSIHAKP